MGWLERMGRRRRGECLECGSPLTPYTLPEARGKSGEFEMVLRDVPLLRCSADSTHAMKLVDDELDVVLAESIQSSDLQIGRLSVPIDCCECGVGLDGRSGGTVTTSGTVELEDFGAVHVAVTGPAATCEACGTVQVYPTYDPDEDYNSALCACFEAMPVELP